VMAGPSSQGAKRRDKSPRRCRDAEATAAGARRGAGAGSCRGLRLGGLDRADAADDREAQARSFWTAQRAQGAPARPDGERRRPMALWCGSSASLAARALPGARRAGNRGTKGAQGRA
jgi:hypothetical protein